MKKSYNRRLDCFRQAIMSYLWCDRNYAILRCSVQISVVISLGFSPAIVSQLSSL